MKHFTIVHIILFILCMLLYKCASAQSQEYLITTRHDTLYGEIKPLSYGAERKVQVTNDGAKKLYSILEVREFKNEGDVFHPVKNASGYVFMKLIKPGYLSLYNYQGENSTVYDAQFLAKKDGTGMEVPNLGFKKHMVRFLEDCPVVASKIENGELSKRDLDAIVDEYNKCIEKRSAPVANAAKANDQQTSKLSAWDALELSVKNHEDFEGKNSALEMIVEIKNKIKRAEKIPNFLMEGLKDTLEPHATLKENLDKAISEIN